jgi:hypothetical protein
MDESADGLTQIRPSARPGWAFSEKATGDYLESDGRAVAHVYLENRKQSGAPQGAGKVERSGYRPSLDVPLNQTRLPTPSRVTFAL